MEKGAAREEEGPPQAKGGVGSPHLGDSGDGPHGVNQKKFFSPTL